MSDANKKSTKTYAEEGPWSRDSIVRNVPVNDIPELARVEKTPMSEMKVILEGMVKPMYTHDEIFGNFAFCPLHVPVPVEIVYEYVSNVYALEEWTYSLRNFKHLGAGLYVADDAAGGPDTKIYVRHEAYPDAGVVDCVCSWDNGHEAWMRYHIRAVDSMKTMRIPGTILTMMNCKHPYYDKKNNADHPDYIKQGQERKDRAIWVGDVWAAFYEAHGIELNNLKKILTARYNAT
jgi:hypothetical protein